MKRILTGIVLGFVWLSAIYSGSLLLFSTIISLVAAISLSEFFTITLSTKERTFRPIGILLGLVPIFGAILGQIDTLLAAYSFALFLLTIFLFAIYNQTENAFLLIAKLCTGITFIGLLSSHLILLMTRADGVYWLFILTMITICSDTGAYYTGKNLGRNKLCPSISPGKTIEGFLGGLATSALIVTIFASFIFPDKPASSIILSTIIIAAIGVTGDLTESIMKRAYKVKDSGTILPGHGGFLDRIDSILASAPALFYAVHFGLI